MYKYIRYPKTLNALREAANPETVGMIRAKRKNLPTNFDDIHRNLRNNRSKPRYKDNRETWGRI